MKRSEMQSAAPHGSVDRIHEADRALARALKTMCEQKTLLPSSVRTDIGKAANLIATWCVLNQRQPKPATR